MAVIRREEWMKMEDNGYSRRGFMVSGAAGLVVLLLGRTALGQDFFSSTSRAHRPSRDDMIGQAGELARLARLEGPAGAEWLDHVRGRIQGSDATSPLGAYAAIVGAFEDYGISYSPAPLLRDNMDFFTAFIQEPRTLLDSRRGDCRESSILTAATMSALGFDAGIFTTLAHVVSYTVLGGDASQEAIDRAVRIDDLVHGPYLLLPIENDFWGGSYDVDDALSRGHRFMEGALPCSDAMALNTSGRMLYQTQMDENSTGLR